VTDARRAVLLSSTRKLQTAAQLMQVKKQQDDIARQLERLGDQRRIKLLQDLQEARTKIGQIRARLQSVGEKLLYTAARSQVMRGNEFKQELTVIRKGKRTRSSSRATSSRLSCGWTKWLGRTSSRRRRASQPRRNWPPRQQALETPRRGGKPPPTRPPETRRLRPLGEPRTRRTRRQMPPRRHWRPREQALLLLKRLPG